MKLVKILMEKFIWDFIGTFLGPLAFAKMLKKKMKCNFSVFFDRVNEALSFRYLRTIFLNGENLYLHLYFGYQLEWKRVYNFILNFLQCAIFNCKSEKMLDWHL